MNPSTSPASRRSLLPAVIAAASAALLLSCAGTGTGVTASDRSPDDYITLNSGESVVQVGVGNNRLQGSQHNLVTTAEQGYRGHAFGETTDIRWAEGEVKGFIGSARVDMTISAEGRELVLRGQWRGRLSSLRVSKAQIQGTVGRCAYSLKAVGSAGLAYRGQSTCGGGQTLLRLPADLDRLPIGQYLATLALVLGR